MAYTKDPKIKKALEEVDSIMTSKGYMSLNQINGYIVTGEPTYLSGPARPVVRDIERDEIVEELLHVYFDR